MKIMIVGDLNYFHYEQALASSFSKLGCIVYLYKYPQFLFSFLEKFFYKFPFFSYFLIFDAVVFLIYVFFRRPVVVFLYRPICFLPWMVCFLRFFGIVVVAYHNDRPLVSSNHCLSKWIVFNRVVKKCDKVYFYRRSTLEEYNLSVPSGIILPYFSTDLYLPFSSEPLCEIQHRLHNCLFDVSFVGHFEDDGRLECVQALHLAGLKVYIMGSGWPEDYKNYCSNITAPKHMFGDDYVSCLRSSKISLCFLSDFNRDLYTRRCYEIPAAGCYLLCQDSSIVSDFYGDSLLFFSTPDSLVNVVEGLMKDMSVLASAIVNSRDRVFNSVFSSDHLSVVLQQEFRYLVSESPRFP